MLLDGRALTGCLPVDVSRCACACCCHRAAVADSCMRPCGPAPQPPASHPALPCRPSPPCSEAAELAAIALAVGGVGSAAVEAHLAAAHGNYEAAAEALQRSAGLSPSHDYASTAPPSEPDTPSVCKGPSWAGDASSAALSAPSPGPASPRAAAVATAFPYASSDPGVYNLADFASADDLSTSPAAGPPAGGSFGSPLPAPLAPAPDAFAAFSEAGVSYEQAYVPPPQERPGADDAEVDVLMMMMGIGG